MNIDKEYPTIEFQHRNDKLHIIYGPYPFIARQTPTWAGLPFAQLTECRTLDRKVAGSKLTRGVVGIVSLTKALHLNCLVLVQLRKKSRYY